MGEERPELRQDLTYPDLRAHVLANRGRLLSAALTVLRGWVAAGKPRFDPLLPLTEPVERRVQIVGVDLAQAELVGQRGLRKLPRTGQLRARLKQPLHDHRQTERALS